MAYVKFYKGTKSSLDSKEKEDGSLYITTDTRKIYLDNNGQRLEIAPQAETDLSNYVTESVLSDSIAAEASEREKQDDLLSDTISSKLDASDIIAGANIEVSHDPSSGHITIAAEIPEIPDVSDFITTSEANQAYAAKTHTHSISNITNLQDNLDTLQSNIDKKANVNHIHSADDITEGILDPARIPDISADKITGVIPEDNLPSYVDAIKEYDSYNDLPLTGETLHIYVTKDTNKTYRWSGSTYVEISPSIALGTTSSTAFRGDYGNIAYQHATAKGSAFTNGLYKITTNSEGHVTAATAVTKSDITALGIPGSTGNNTTYELTKSGSTITLVGTDGSKSSVTDSDTNTTYSNATTSTAGLMSAADKTKLDGIASEANKYTLPIAGTTLGGIKTDYASSGKNYGIKVDSDGSAYVSVPWTDTNTDTNTTYTLSKTGSTIKLEGSDGTTTSVTDSNTTYSAATSSANGLMSAADKAKLDGIASGANAYSLPTASATTLGGVKVGSGLSISSGVLSTNVTLSSLGVNATAAELNYMDGVTSNVQTQLNNKAASSHNHAASNITSGTLAAARLPIATTSTIGAVKIGSGLSIGSDGTISAASSGDTTWYTSKTQGQLYKATDAPTGTTRGCYDGYFYATRVYNAVYIDYAEYFPKKEDIEVGHVAYASENGATSTGKAKTCIGIVSDQYGHLLGGNGTPDDDENFVAIAVAGRVPLEIEGNISIGDMVRATRRGTGKKANAFTSKSKIVGKVVGLDPKGRFNYREVLVGGR